MKKVIAFDLDDTLAISKSPVADRMGELLVQLLDHFEVCIISGGKFEQFKKQVIDRLEASPEQLGRMHLMPTCGTRYYRYDALNLDWELQYAEDLTEDEKATITKVLEETAKAGGLWPEKPYGDVIEDRNSQVSISFLGQQAPPDIKSEWAATYAAERMKVRAAAADLLPDFEVRAGGSTTLDVTRIGIDKAYGMHKLLQALEISKEDVLFMGDKLQEGGNDYPVKAMGIDSVEVDRWEDTALALTAILHVL
ncbi:MAG: HAD-IIB family hydrolase [Patescibacteria group bacterium]|nr:HAD-IIB family hydrolase [Patescibacteria group bacterium]